MAVLYLLYLASKGAILFSLIYKICCRFQCRLMGRLCFLITLYSAIGLYKSILFQALMGLIVMEIASNFNLLLSNFNDFGLGFIIFGFFSNLFNVFVLFFVSILGFLYLLYIRKGQENRIDIVNKLSSHNRTIKDQNLEEINESVSLNDGFNDNIGNNIEPSDECCNEDQVFDVITLRKMVKDERERANNAHNELEKERMAAASAIDEAMAMILRLQNEKSVLQMEVNQLNRAAEDKQLHDQEIIQSLEWIVMKHESERSVLDDQLRMCREKLKMFMKGEEWDQFDSICPTPSVFYSSMEEIRVKSGIGLLDFESSPM
ncbi:unnamed protein product [Amaranthus hypochondriacus]